MKQVDEMARASAGRETCPVSLVSPVRPVPSVSSAESAASPAPLAPTPPASSTTAYRHESVKGIVPAKALPPSRYEVAWAAVWIMSGAGCT
ncbi:hypothetical protein [Bifidobacterium tibiigranuli]|uniref:hypothetical protein n=1 Tax=Bifidobacterium tibiigranuli TaxID=2172043 RepID=UPI0023576E9D|nr:hypothetical protein [Bifidobacterium tibiigranuli]MCI1222113.1 hypothetical protein [Bifidobacterium tibiigranuli]